jgi:hypothetical protein
VWPVLSIADPRTESIVKVNYSDPTFIFLPIPIVQKLQI